MDASVLALSYLLIRPEFRDGVAQLIDLIFSKAQAKR